MNILIYFNDIIKFSFIGEGNGSTENINIPHGVTDSLYHTRLHWVHTAMGASRTHKSLVGDIVSVIVW